MKTFVLTLGLFLSAAIGSAQTPESSAPEATNGQEQAVSEQLAAARKQLLILRTRHGERHPAVEKQRRTIAELQKKSNGESPTKPEDRATQLENAKRELAVLRERYTDLHPLVKSQLLKIAELERSNAQ
jgi:hypothetical protein